MFDAHLELEKKGAHNGKHIHARSLVHDEEAYVSVRVCVCVSTYDHNRAITLCMLFHGDCVCVCVFERGVVGDGILPTIKDHFKQRKLTNNNTK